MLLLLPACLVQGQKVATAGNDPFGLGVNISYSGCGLYESSTESSSSSSCSFLPPVPSLPGLATADGSSNNPAQQLTLRRGPAAAGKSASPVQHRAWQHIKQAASQQAGALKLLLILLQATCVMIQDTTPVCSSQHLRMRRTYSAVSPCFTTCSRHAGVINGA
jgi:hypothetical protein